MCLNIIKFAFILHYEKKRLVNTFCVYFPIQCVPDGTGQPFGVSGTSSPGDIIDNDCDGITDEELNNGIGESICVAYIY